MIGNIYGLLKKRNWTTAKLVPHTAHHTPHLLLLLLLFSTFFLFFFVEKLFSTSLVCLKQLSQPNHGNGMGHITYTDTDADIPAKSPPINNKTQNI